MVDKIKKSCGNCELAIRCIHVDENYSDSGICDDWECYFSLFCNCCEKLEDAGVIGIGYDKGYSFVISRCFE